jgi:ATP-dependent Clp protease, protease subunit
MVTSIFKKNVRADEVPIVQVEEFSMCSLIEFKREFMLLEMNPQVTGIVVEISSYGGQVYSLLGMIDCIESSSKPVFLSGSGIVASCAAVLLCSGSKGNRWMGPNTKMHIHPVQCMIRGDSDGVLQEAIDVSKLTTLIYKKIVKNSNMTITQLKSKLKDKNKEWNLGAEEALRCGFIDHIGVPKYTGVVTYLIN